MAECLPDQITTCTPEEMFHALGNAWVEKFNERPKVDSILCLLCQWALETGWGKSCHCWNIGNFKSKDGDGRDYVYFKCDERLSPVLAQKYINSAQPRSDGSGLPNVAFRSNNKDGTVTVWFWPDHPVSKFRAYKTIEDGVRDYINSLHKKFYLAWPAVEIGDPAMFVQQLKVQKYFTADEEIYKKTQVKLFNSFKKNYTFNIIPILEEEDKNDINNLIDEDERNRIEGLIALTLDQSYRSIDSSDDSSEKNS